MDPKEIDYDGVDWIHAPQKT